MSMAKLTWKKKRPTEPGYYWFAGRYKDTDPDIMYPRNVKFGPVIVRLFDGTHESQEKGRVDVPDETDLGYVDLEDLYGKWAGPIEPPEG